jgi:hypothetical protein
MEITGLPFPSISIFGVTLSKLGTVFVLVFLLLVVREYLFPLLRTLTRELIYPEDQIFCDDNGELLDIWGREYVSVDEATDLPADDQEMPDCCKKQKAPPKNKKSPALADYNSLGFLSKTFHRIHGGRKQLSPVLGYK